MIYTVTGHRPNKLGGYSDQAEGKVLRFAVHVLRQVKPELVFDGMALGWDQAVCYACIKLGIPYVACVPYKGFGENWEPEYQERLVTLLNKARDVYYVTGYLHYQPWLMQSRNEYMVDRADTVLALWNGTKGGTYNCVRYAEKVGKPYVNFWEQWLTFELE